MRALLLRIVAIALALTVCHYLGLFSLRIKEWLPVDHRLNTFLGYLGVAVAVIATSYALDTVDWLVRKVAIFSCLLFPLYLLGKIIFSVVYYGIIFLILARAKPDLLVIGSVPVFDRLGAGILIGSVPIFDQFGAGILIGIIIGVVHAILKQTARFRRFTGGGGQGQGQGGGGQPREIYYVERQGPPRYMPPQQQPPPYYPPQGQPPPYYPPQNRPPRPPRGPASPR